MKEIILVGDSIRMGYQTIVKKELDGLASVWGPEENGGNSINVLSHLDEWALSRPCSIVHINCGLHDMRQEFDATEPVVPLDRYEANVREIMKRVLRSGGTTVIWATTTPVNEKLHHRNKPFDRFEPNVSSYNAAAIRVAREFKIPVNDLFSLMQDAGPEHYLREDGVHFTDAGYELLGKAVANFIRSYLTGA